MCAVGPYFFDGMINFPLYFAEDFGLVYLGLIKLFLLLCWMLIIGMHLEYPICSNWKDAQGYKKEGCLSINYW